MSHADTGIVSPQHPDPHRAPSARLDAVGVGKILRLLRTLFVYGRNLAQTLREEDDPDDIPWYGFLTILFSTTDPSLITVLIIRGLLRATALQARLSGSLAHARGSLLPLPVQEGGIRAPGRAQPRAAGRAFPPGWPATDPSLGQQPEPEEEMYAKIVAQDRDRPIGAILLDICVDLGIVPALMDPATWDELRLAITLYGGDPAPLLACDVHAASPVGIPDPGDSPPIPVAGQPAITYPPWPAPPEHPLEGESDRWGRGPGP